MAKEKAWYADSAVGTLLADLFEGKWSPELLAQLAQIPLAEAERGAFPGCPPSSSCSVGKNVYNPPPSSHPGPILIRKRWAKPPHLRFYPALFSSFPV